MSWSVMVPELASIACSYAHLSAVQRSVTPLREMRRVGSSVDQAAAFARGREDDRVERVSSRPSAAFGPETR